MVLLRRLAVILALLFATSTHAAADATLFVGNVSTPANRAAKGFAVGASLLVVGAEFEWSSANEVGVDGSPGVVTGSGNVFLQTPVAVLGLRPYVTTGLGGYRERLADAFETGVAFNSGLGVKVSLFGPLRARIDYRNFRLRGQPRHPTVHRAYIGLNLAF